MASIGARGRELAELVPDHRLADEDGDVLAAVVDRDRVADHLGEDRRGARPGLDHLLRGRPRSSPRYATSAAPRRRAPSCSSGSSLALPATATADDVAIGLLAASCACDSRASARPTASPGGGPAVVEPSPPPCGWSTGFIATPRVCGRTPRWRLRPALPILTFWCSALPITPTVARHSARTRRISPDGRRSVAMSPSLAINWIEVPAERPSWPPRPGGQLDVVHDRAGRHLRERQAVADGDVDVLARGRRSCRPPVAAGARM